MKKTYLNPTTDFIFVATQQMMAGSVEASIKDESQDNEDALSRGMRRQNAWGDDEEDY